MHQAVRNQAWRPSTDDVLDALHELCDAGYLRELPASTPGAKRGRPGTPPFVVNPTWDRSTHSRF